MQVVVLHGSPHREGNSNTLTKSFIDGLNNHEKPSISHFYLNELNIGFCQGCLYCATSEDHRCKLQDDMQQIYTDFKKADLVIFATPMYWGYMTGQMKIMFDRMEALAWDGLHGKELVVIITYHHHYETTISFFERIAPFFKLKMHYLVCCTKNMGSREDFDEGSDNNVKSIPGKLKEAFDLGNKFGLR